MVKLTVKIVSMQDADKFVGLFQTSGYGLIIGREPHLCYPLFSERA